jgi:hypothetical protein
MIKKFIYAFKFAFLTLMFLSQQAVANPLMGAWEIAESKWNNEKVKLPEPRAVKIYSAENFMYSYYDISKPEGVLIGQGSYVFSDGNVSETISNHSNKELIGEVYKFEISFSEDKSTFSQTVMFGENKLDEVWRRLD